MAKRKAIKCQALSACNNLPLLQMVATFSPRNVYNHPRTAQWPICELHSGPSQEHEVFYWHRFCSPTTLSITYTHRPDFKTKKMEERLTILSVLVLKVVTLCIVTALWRLTCFRLDRASISDRKALCKNPRLVTSLPPSA
jgi:hypothetical protein